MSRTAPTTTLTVFCNADCPVCRHEIDRYRRYAEDRSLPLQWTDVAAEPDVLGRRGIDPETQRRSLHAMTPEGRVVAGVDAFNLMWRRMPRFRWLAGLLQPSLMRAAARFAYDRLLAPALYRLDHRRRRRLPHDNQN